MSSSDTNIIGLDKDTTVLPQSLVTLAEQINDAGGPRSWVRENIALFIVGGILEVVFGIAGIIQNVVQQAFGAVRTPFADTVAGLSSLGGIFVGSRTDPGALWQLVLAVEGVATAAGPFGVFVWAGAFAVVIGLIIRLAPVAVEALGDLLGAVPVIGGPLSAGFTVLAGILNGGEG
jgi:hypothetical protein